MTYEQWYDQVKELDLHGDGDELFVYMVSYPEHAARLHREVCDLVREHEPELLGLMHPELSGSWQVSKH